MNQEQADSRVKGQTIRFTESLFSGRSILDDITELDRAVRSLKRIGGKAEAD